MLQRTAAITAALVITLVSASGCASGPGGTTSSATTAAVPQMDAQVGSSLDDALRTVQASPGVASATNRIELHQRYTAADGTDVTPPGLDAWNNRDAGPTAPPPIGAVSPDDPVLPPVPTPSARPAPPAGATETHSFTSAFVVTMDPDASPSEAAAVPVAMAKRIAWTGVTLTLQVPAGPGHVLSTVTYSGTFDQQIPDDTALGVASGLARLAATAGVTGLEASIPRTMRVDYGSLTIEVSPADDATLARVRHVIDGTAFAGTTLHGSFGNGAKP
ncbi:hypothetical protein Csp2054_09695 [Curtobacterium sp. 'Ferrero']|uniref:hypothetical protein n=1 Tax=Curtobacterium sp. 'Ferrero' TaxID=2033654 RepID=UPI000BC3B901|nr:hypothetical protein [Curtobacterium sp. 'Ferrero']PCN47876.1 hypothetical protein Csp2054_09695 [Curtobacterium sp. 'Ferrero']